MSTTKTLSIVILLLIVVVGLSSVYTVKEGEQALVLRLGKIQLDKSGNPMVVDPGLHFKVPFISQVRKFDVRLQTLDIKSSRIVTEEKKDVIVDYYAKWRINNLPLYYTRTGGQQQTAQLLLEQQLNDNLRAEFGRRTISDVVSDDRVDIMKTLEEQAEAKADKLGIRVVDVRIKGIDLPTEVRQAVFNRMIAERSRVARKHRADGKADAEKIEAGADAKAKVIVASAKTKGAETRAAGDSEAAQIYAKAYSKNQKFYAFYKSLDAYKQTFNNKQDLIVLRPDNEFFKYFNDATGSQQKASS